MANTTSGRKRLFSEAVIVALFGLGGVLAASAITSYFNYQTANRGLDAKLVEIGINILTADPSKSDVSPARQWAIDLVESKSGQAFAAEDRSALLHKPLRSIKWLAEDDLRNSPNLKELLDQPSTPACGVIKDGLKGVTATTPDGQRRLDDSYERGRVAGCWP